MNYREGMWELYWIVFRGQTRIRTFQNLKALGYSRREAAEAIHDCEREG